MQTSTWIGGLVGGAVVCGMVLWGGSDDRDEEAVAVGIQAMADAVERGDREAFWAHLAPDFHPVGRYIRHYRPEMIVDRIFQLPARMDPLEIVLENLSVEVSDDGASAKVRFKVQLIGEGMLWSVTREQLDRNRVQLKMRRYGDDWRVLEASLAWSVMPF